MSDAELTIRRAGEDDLDAALVLLRDSMGRSADPRFEALFRWKHLENAFGPSPMWVATDGDRLAGLRVFMRWEFERGVDVLRAVRAVDTATHPDYQGRGIFTSLTLGALPDLSAEPVDFIFNTPNDKSRPGYLKMGWHELGRLPAAMRPTRLTKLPALRKARAAAEHWSEPVEWGRSVTDVLADDAAVRALLDSRLRTTQARTRLDGDVLRWRYGTPLLSYRAVTVGSTLADGVAFVRVRRRGTAREVVVALALVPGDDRGPLRRLLRGVTRAARSDADYLLAIAPPHGLPRLPGFIPLSRLGPVLTARELATHAPERREELALTLGDVELF